MARPTRYIPIATVADTLGLSHDDAARRARAGAFGDVIRLSEGNQGRLRVSESGVQAFLRRAREAVAPKTEAQ